MPSRGVLFSVMMAVLFSHAAAPAGADVSISFQESGGDGRRYDRERERDPYRPYRHEYRRVRYSRLDVEPQPYGQQALPDNSSRDLTSVSQKLYDVKQLLDQKGSQGAITQDQHHAEANYLAQIDKEAHTNAFNQGGHLTGDQETYFLQQLQQIEIAIDQNLVVH